MLRVKGANVSLQMPIKKYRWKWWYFASEILITLFISLTWGIMIYGVLSVVSRMMTNPNMISILLILLLLSFVPIGLIWIFISIWKIGHLLQAPIVAFDNGLEIRSWPQYRVFLNWDQLPEWKTQIGLLHLDKATDLPLDRAAALIHVPMQRIITRMPKVTSLNRVEGFPKGALADLLHQHTSDTSIRD
jgi:hypothetical protein